MILRPAEPGDVPALARLWFDAWQDAHAALVPAELTRLRTLDGFAERLAAGIADVRVIGTADSELGFSMIRGDELYQFFVAAPARGTGVAAALMADAEARLAERGVETAWLACTIGNRRATRFYEKSGWHRARTEVVALETREGPFDMAVWRYEKRLTHSP